MATSKAQLLPESAITFRDTGSSPTVLFTNTSLGAGAGRQSAQHDLTASAHSFLFQWSAFCQFATTPVVGETVDIYIKTSDGTHLDNDDGTGDAALSAEDKLKNLQYIGSIVVDEASATPEFSASGVVAIYARFFHVVFFNNTADAFSSTAAEHGMSMIPMTIQGQAT